MVIHGNTGNTWQYKVIYDNTWQYMAIHGNTWRYMVIHTPMLGRQERHNEGTLTALMSTESLVQQDGCDNHTHEGKPARAYNITQCRRHCLLAQPLLPRK